MFTTNRYKVWFQHVRFDEPKPHPLNEKKLISHITVCFIAEADQAKNSFVMLGRAFCSTGDNFSRAEGRKRALTNAVQRLSREERRQIWRSYWAKLEESRALSAVAELERLRDVGTILVLTSE